VTGMTSDRYTARFGWVLLLAVTTFRGNQIPAIFLNQLGDFTNFHGHSCVRVHQCS